MRRGAESSVGSAPSLLSTESVTERDACKDDLEVAVVVKRKSGCNANGVRQSETPKFDEHAHKRNMDTATRTVEVQGVLGVLAREQRSPIGEVPELHAAESIQVVLALQKYEPYDHLLANATGHADHQLSAKTHQFDELYSYTIFLRL